jgi:hypothetical protein
MQTIRDIKCAFCKHFYRSKRGFFCRAFPTGDGIPREIIDEQTEHDKVLPEQKGKWVFEEKKD